MSILNYIKEDLDIKKEDFIENIKLNKDILTIVEDNAYHHLVRFPNSKYITETNLNKMLTTHTNAGYIVISAYRGENTKEENNIQNKKLLADIKNLPYSFIPVWGGYSEKPRDKEGNEIKDAPLNQSLEKSYIITNYPKGKTTPIENTNELFEIGKKLADDYEQESFLYKPSKGSKLYNEDVPNKAYWITPSGDIDGEFSGAKPTNVADAYFTRMSKSHRDIIDYKNKKTNEIEPARKDKAFTYTFDSVVYFENKFSTLSEGMGRRYGEQFLFFDIDDYIRAFNKKYNKIKR